MQFGNHKIIFDTATELTIVSDAITVAQSNHKLQPQTGTSDNLSTINGTGDGQMGVLYVSDFGTDTITIKHNVGNILCVGGSDITLSNGCVYWYSNGTKVFCSGGGGGAAGREKLTGNRTYYVRTDGSDSNTGLTNTAGGAFLTIQKAVDIISGSLDLNGYTVTVQVGNGTYTGAVQLKPVVGYGGAGTLILVGDETTPANVVISTSSDCFSDAPDTAWDVRGFKLQSSAGSALSATRGGTIRFQKISFGLCAGNHMNADAGGSKIEATGNYWISGNAGGHYYNTNLSYILASNVTVTLLANVTLTYFCVCGQLAAQRVYGNTYTLGGFTVTATRYLVNGNSVVFTNGGGANYFPGSAAGSAPTGGQYL